MIVDAGPLEMLAALSSAMAAGLAVKLLAPPPRRLRTRVAPYLTPSLGDLREPSKGGVVRSIYGPILEDLATWVGRALDRAGSAVTLSKLRQAGWFSGSDEKAMVASYRMAQLKSISVATLAGIAVGQVLGLTVPLRGVLVLLALLVGASRTRGRLEKAIETRRDRMKIEIYTVNQLLAMRVRGGGGVVQAVRATVERGTGDVVSELDEALRLHRSGWRAADAFRRIAEVTPEPFCARTYRLLASAEERGVDLADALLALSEDVRETRRESIRRTATRRRAAMLLPTVAILAPVLILFVAAPLPYLITSWQ